MTIKVEEIGDGTITISWDPNDPVESIMNTWNDEKFEEVLRAHANSILQETTITSGT